MSTASGAVPDGGANDGVPDGGANDSVPDGDTTGKAGWVTANAAWQAGIAVIALVVLAVFPLVFTNALVTTIGVDAIIFVAAAAAWNIFSGYSGYISLGHAVFFGTGAYTVAIAARDWHLTGDAVFALLPLAAVMAAAVAVPFGLVALRVRRHTFVVVTIAFFFIFQLMAFNFAFTGGSSGIIAPILNWQPETYNNPFYYLALAIAAATVGLSWVIRGSRFGLQLRAIRDDEDRAAGLGVRTMQVKLAGFVISAFITGLVGGLWFYFIGEALPQFAFDPLFDLSVALMAFFGGLGTVAGPVLGALVIEPAQQYLTVQISNDYLSQILLGALFLVVILLLPRGVIPTVSEKVTTWRARRAGRSGAASARARASKVAGGGAEASSAAAGSAAAPGSAGASSAGASSEGGSIAAAGARRKDSAP
jgi:branched-chain amino acid transport system permease protein